MDYFKLEEKLGLKNRRKSDKYDISKNNSKENKEQHNHDEIILDTLAKSHGNTNRLAFIITHGKGYKIYIGIIVIGFIFMSLAHSGLNLPIIEKLHSLEEVIAVIGILFSIIYMWCFKRYLKILIKRKKIKDFFARNAYPFCWRNIICNYMDFYCISYLRFDNINFRWR